MAVSFFFNWWQFWKVYSLVVGKRRSLQTVHIHAVLLFVTEPSLELQMLRERGKERLSTNRVQSIWRSAFQDKAPRLSISNDSWILSSYTIICQLNQYLQTGCCHFDAQLFRAGTCSLVLGNLWPWKYWRRSAGNEWRMKYEDLWV